MEFVSDEMQQCIEECTSCHRICLETVTHCMQMGGPHTAPEHLRLMLDCVEICQTSANFMLRQSDLHSHTCAACAEVCEWCAEDCGRFAEEFMQRCAEACRRCAESCRRMSSGRPLAMAA